MSRSDNDDRIVVEEMFSLDESDVAGTSIICLVSSPDDVDDHEDYQECDAFTAMKDHQDVSPSTSVIIPDDHEESGIRKSMHQLLQGRTCGGKSSSLQNMHLQLN